MNNSTRNKPQRITPSELSAVAAEGVSRALAARESCLRELTPQELAEVSGGGVSIALSKGIIAGGRRPDLAAFALKNQLTTPILDQNLAGGGLMDMNLARMV